ncbi:serine hydrolase domain-containing protein [candidate division KSB1 bacterium]
MKKKGLILFLIASMTIYFCSSNPSIVDPTLGDRLQSTLENALSKCQNARGATTAVSIPGKTVWVGASGYSGPTEADKMRPEMLFEIGKTKNTFTAALILKYVEEGLLSLEDPISNWITEYQNIDPGITVRQLLDHSSGIYDYASHYNYPMRYFFYYRTKEWTPESILTLFINEPYFSPGSNYWSSNTNYLLLQMIIDEISNSDRIVQFRDRIFDPLSLSNTYIDYFEDIPENEIAHGWYWDEQGIYVDIYPEARTAWATFNRLSIFTSAEDILKWYKALFEGQVINQSSLNDMTSFKYVIGNQYDLGIAIEQTTYKGMEVWSNKSTVFGYETRVLYIPELNVYASLMCNFNGDGLIKIMPRLLDVVLEELGEN